MTKAAGQFCAENKSFASEDRERGVNTIDADPYQQHDGELQPDHVEKFISLKALKKWIILLVR
jgi:hypothetical protein